MNSNIQPSHISDLLGLLNDQDIAVVLCSFNGEAHIQAQIESLLQQTMPFTLLVFDDGSSDGTLAIVKRYILQTTAVNAEHAEHAEQHGESSLPSHSIELQCNIKNLGYVANFEQGIAQVVKREFKYIALSDQDDIWDPTRLAKNIQEIIAGELALGVHTPLLSHSDLKLIDNRGVAIHSSFLRYRQYDISENKNTAAVLGQNGVMGNTCMFNNALATLALPFPPTLPVHDYWLALIAELFGQRYFINEQLVSYRIHQSNASNSDNSLRFGAHKWLHNKSFKGLLERDFRLPFKEDTRVASIDYLLTEQRYVAQLNTDNVNLLRIFKDYLTERKPSFSRFIRMQKLGFFKKGTKHNLRLWFSYFTTKRYKTR